jgi:hypothetical protein
MSYVRGQKVREIATGKIYDFGYISTVGAAVCYEEGEQNMQDAIAFRPDLIEAVSPQHNLVGNLLYTALNIWAWNILSYEESPKIPTGGGIFHDHDIDEDMTGFYFIYAEDEEGIQTGESIAFPGIIPQEIVDEVLKQLNKELLESGESS